MIKRLFRIVVLGIVIIVLLIIFAPSLIRGAGNALLSSTNNSSAQGIAELIPHPQDNGSDLQLKLDGLAPNASYYVTLEEGQCGGFILSRVGQVVTDSSGSATSSLTLNGSSDQLNALRSAAAQQSLWIDVHQGNDASGQSVACGQVLSSTASDLQPTAAPTPTVDNGSTSSSLQLTPTPGVPSGVSNDGSNGSNSGSGSDGSLFPGIQPLGGFPNTGVAPTKHNAYNNNTYPRKY